MLKIIAAAASIMLTQVVQVDARTIVDDGGRTVEIPEVVSRVLPAGPPASALIYVLAPETLLSWTHELTDVDKQMLLPRARTLPVSARLSGNRDTIDVEAISAARPDIIIDVGAITDPYIRRANEVQARTGIPYVIIDGSLSRSARSLRLVGEIVNLSSRGEELARYADERLSALADPGDETQPGPAVSLFYGRGRDGLETFASGSLNAEIFDLVGARNVAQDPGRSKPLAATIEQISDWNPAVVLTTAPSLADRLRRDETLADIDAVRTGRIYKVPTGPFGWVEAPPSVNRLLGLLWLQCVLYPDRAGVDLVKETRQFYSLFYHVELTRRQLDDLLGGTALPPSCE